jgi:serine protease Do
VLAVLAALALSACMAAPLTTKARPTPPSPGPPLPRSNDAYDPSTDPVVRVVDAVAPAVVNVTARTLGQDELSGGTGPGQAVGTGFGIRSDGFIVTNYHVIEGALSVKVALPPPDNRTFDARWVGGDPNHDLAILKVDGVDDLPTVPLGDSSRLQLGERVIALGYALALPGGPTVTTGVISSLARTIQAQDPNAPDGTRTYEDVLQTDAAINPGNSGGPLVDLAGNVVGINTAGAGSAENVGFSIAIDAARAVIDHTIANPERPLPYLGVSTTTVGPGVAGQLNLTVDHGALVMDVAPGGAADKAGIEKGDVIVAFDGKAVNGSVELGKLILPHRVEDTVTVRVVRPDGSTDDVRATLGTRPVPVVTPSP